MEKILEYKNIKGPSPIKCQRLIEVTDDDDDDENIWEGIPQTIRFSTEQIIQNPNATNEHKIIELHLKSIIFFPQSKIAQLVGVKPNFVQRVISKFNRNEY